jgi:hypothetical protein
MNDNSDDRKRMKQTFSDNCNTVNGLCQSLKNVAEYRLHLLKEIKEQLGNASIWKKD